MAESEPSRALHDSRLTSEVIGAALGSFLASEAAPAPTPMPSPAYTLQFLIAVIKESDRKIDPRA
jgi:hypothetical protein